MVEYTLTVTPTGDDRFEAMIQCPSFVDSIEGLADIDEALAWAIERTDYVDNPFAAEAN